MVEIKASKRLLEVYFDNTGLNNVLRSAPGQRFYDALKGCWQVVPSPLMVRFLLEHLPADTTWATSAKELVNSILKVQKEREDAQVAKNMENFQLDYTFKTAPYEHQKRALYVSAMMSTFGLFMEMGCVDKETEYLSPEGWVKISEYRGGKVAQFNLDGTAEFVEPVAYVKKPCYEFIHFKHSDGLDQMLSPDHRMLFERQRRLKSGERWRVKTAIEAERSLNQSQGAEGFSHHDSLPCSFGLKLPWQGLGITDEELRVMVAVIADGSFVKGLKTSRCYVNLKKTRKILRLTWLLNQAKMAFAAKSYTRGHAAGYTKFSFIAPIKTKEFNKQFWACNSHQLEIIMNECYNWGGTVIDGVQGCFVSCNQANAEFIQYAYVATGQPALLHKSYNDGKLAYTVTPRHTTRLVLSPKPENYARVPSADGFMYCFSVPSSFLVFRRNGCVFVSGNTGKSKVAIDNAAILFDRGKITGVLIVCPNSVKRNWADLELEKHLPEELTWRVAIWQGGYRKDEQEQLAWLFKAVPGQSLPWLIVNYEALITERGFAVVQNFLRRFTCLMICDESQMIKTPAAKRTRAAVRLGRLAPYRRILTGTPITNNPMDLYSQFAFLDQSILGHPSFFTFRQRYAVMGGFEGRQIVAYKHLDELEDLVRGHSFRVRKADCLDLPPRVYETRFVQLTKDQLNAYHTLKEKTRLELQGATVTASIILTKLLRFQQITGGAVPDEHGNLLWFQPNPKLTVLLETIDELQGKVVIWARFHHEIELIVGKLAELYGPETVVKFYGEVSQDARAQANTRFQLDSTCRFFVATPATGGIGVNLSAASTEIFYSNDFDMGHRNQAEERLDRADELTKLRLAHGESTVVIDLVAEKTVDTKIVKALQTKKKIADIVISERFLEEDQ